MRLAIEKIRPDGGTFPRAVLDRKTAGEYAAAMRDGHVFPPVTVFFDGTDYWLADGFHRLAACRQLGFQNIEVDIKPGSPRDALLHSVGANAAHGLPRSPADKRHAVTLLLRDPEWGRWSDRAIARATVTSHPFVARVRAGLTGNVSSERHYITKHGTGSLMDTSAIGKSPPRLSPELHERLREYQRRLGLDNIEAAISGLLESSPDPTPRRPAVATPGTRRWLGIDPGLASPGWAILEGGEDSPLPPGLIARGTIKTARELPTPGRLLELERDLVSLLREFEPTDVALEIPLGNPNPKTERTVSEAIGVIHLVCYRELGIVPVHLFPSMWKAHLGNGRAGNEEVTGILRGLFEIEGSRGERLDAIGIAHAAFHGVGIRA